MDKASNFYGGEVIHFATKHEKDGILAPLFQALNIACLAVPVDTDLFGTFSGEVERQGSIRETLRKKIAAATEHAPAARLLLASEGSFGPDPFLGFVQTDLESLLLWDRELNIEIYAEHLSRSPVHAEATLGPRDDFRKFLKENGFPEHGVIVRPQNSFSPVFKGLHSEYEVVQAMLDCFAASSTGKVVVATDLRANHNPTRQGAILSAGKALVEKILSTCPACGLPGYAITRGIPGLSCSGCGETTQAIGKVLVACVKCAFAEERPRPDGKTSVSPSECEHCNP